MGFDLKPDTPNNVITNNVITNNVVTNKYITYLCIGITVEDYGEQAFYIRHCDIG